MTAGWTAVLFLLTAVAATHCLYVEGGGREPRKRPFCNAFTGCGRKRADIPPLTEADVGAIVELGPVMREEEAVEESLGTLLDLSAEPAVEDLSRQIMSEAKLWEAIQEANMEITRQKTQAREHQHHQRHDDPAAAAAAVVQAAVAEAAEEARDGGARQLKCALPSCIAI